MCAVIAPTGIIVDDDQDKTLKLMNINEFHKKTHQGESIMRYTAVRCGLRLNGTLDPCIHCSRATSKRKKISKETIENEEVKPGERISIDITSCKADAMQGYKYMHGKLDNNTGMIFPTFIKKKSDAIADMVNFIKMVKEKYNREIKYIRCDVAGENKKMKEIIAKNIPKLFLNLHQDQHCNKMEKLREHLQQSGAELEQY